jgi:hypothetical protein
LNLLAVPEYIDHNGLPRRTVENELIQIGSAVDAFAAVADDLVTGL